MQTALLWIAGVWFSVACLLLVRQQYLVFHGGMLDREPREHFSDRARNAALWPFILIDLVVQLIRAFSDDEEEGT